MKRNIAVAADVIARPSGFLDIEAATRMRNAQGTEGDKRVDDTASTKIEGVIVGRGLQIDAEVCQAIDHRFIGSMQRGQIGTRWCACPGSANDHFKVGEGGVSWGKQITQARHAGPLARANIMFDERLTKQVDLQRPLACTRWSMGGQQASRKASKE
jgi:hypothetical protein